VPPAAAAPSSSGSHDAAEHILNMKISKFGQNRTGFDTYMIDWHREARCLGWFQGSRPSHRQANDLYWPPRVELTYVKGVATGLAIAWLLGIPEEFLPWIIAGFSRTL
jgi:hypothetical protein